MNAVNNAVILMTGAAGGLGAAAARLLAERGATLVLCDLDQAALDAVVETMPKPCMARCLDVTDYQQCEEAVTATVAEYGRIDVVWSNAGISIFGPAELIDASEWHKVIDVNLNGAYNIVKAALPEVIAAQGYVALTASGASFAHSPGHSAYAASKAGLEAFADSLRSEVAHQGVDVGAFHPLWVRTPMVTVKQENNEAFNVLLGALPAPLRRLTEVEDMAAVLVEAVVRRRGRVVYPCAGWALYWMRSLLPIAPLVSATRKVAPEIRATFAAQHSSSPHAAPD